MPLILFWLVPVILVVVLLMVILHDQESRSKPRLLIFDPLSIVSHWITARVIGDQKTVIENLSLLKQALPGNGSFIEDFLQKMEAPKLVPIKGVTLRSYKKAGRFSEYYQFDYADRVSSVLIGDLTAVIELSDSTWDGKIDDAKLSELAHHEATALEHGFLVMAVATRISREPAAQVGRMKLAGLLVCEPQLDARKEEKIRAAAGGCTVRSFSLLPLPLTLSFAKKVFPAMKWQAVSATSLNDEPPKQRLKILEKNNLIAETSAEQRYECCLAWRHAYQLKLVAGHPEDAEHLPCERVSI